jgi:hypothetical protein
MKEHRKVTRHNLTAPVKKRLNRSRSVWNLLPKPPKEGTYVPFLLAKLFSEAGKYGIISKFKI